MITECLGIVVYGQTGAAGALYNNLAKAINFVTYKNSKADYGVEMASWLFAAIECLFYGQEDAVISLIAIARDKATALEEKRARDNFRHMKQWFGCGNRSVFKTKSAPAKRSLSLGTWSRWVGQGYDWNAL